MKVSSLLPITRWARSYNKEWLRPDIIAGITVGAFTIPEAMAYVSLAGLPPQIGLYSAMVALLVYMLFGTSRQLSLGPTSTLSILVGSTLGSLMIVSTSQYFMMVSLVAVMVGVLALLSWALRLGFVIKNCFNRFFSRYSIIYCFRADSNPIWNIRSFRHFFPANVLLFRSYWPDKHYHPCCRNCRNCIFINSC